MGICHPQASGRLSKPFPLNLGAHRSRRGVRGLDREAGRVSDQRQKGGLPQQSIRKGSITRRWMKQVAQADIPSAKGKCRVVPSCVQMNATWYKGGGNRHPQVFENDGFPSFFKNFGVQRSTPVERNLVLLGPCSTPIRRDGIAGRIVEHPEDSMTRCYTSQVISGPIFNITNSCIGRGS